MVIKSVPHQVRVDRYVFSLNKGLVILLLFVSVSLLGCAALEIITGEPVTPAEPEFTYSIGVSAPPIQISGGNLHWHKKLPDTTYTLEDAAIEIHNFGDSDITVAQLEIKVDENSKLFDIDITVPPRTKENVVVHPSMEGYDGGIHTVYVSLLDKNGRILYQNNGQEMGPLEPVPGTGSWHPVQMQLTLPLNLIPL